MRFNATDQNMVAVDDQVVRGDGGGQIVIRALHIFHPVSSGNMFHHHPQARGLLPDRVQHAVYEHGFAVKNVDVGICYLAMHAQGQADFGHAFQHTAHLVKVRNPRGRIGRRPGRIQFYR